LRASTLVDYSLLVLNDTAVIHSQLLRYLIHIAGRLGRLSFHDPLIPGYTTSQRIEALEKCEATWHDVYIGGSHHVKYTFTCQFPRNLPGSSACLVHNGFMMALKTVDNPAYAYVDLRTFQPWGAKDPWTTITNDSWRGKTCHFVVSVEQDLVLAVL
jgi:hypothetical protein